MLTASRYPTELTGGIMRTDFSEEHNELRRMMDRFAELMASSDEDARAELPRQRVLFSQLFNTHMAKELSHLRTLVASPPGSRFLPLVQDYQDRVALLRSDYSAHVRRWTPGAIDSGWPAYKAAVLSLQGRFRELMDWEERNLIL
jgi:hypothetical protein